MKVPFADKLVARVAGVGVDQSLIRTAWAHGAETGLGRDEAAAALLRIRNRRVNRDGMKGAPDIDGQRVVLAERLQQKLGSDEIDLDFIETSRRLANFVVDDGDAFLLHSFAVRHVHQHTLMEMRSSLAARVVLHMTCISRIERARESIGSFQPVGEGVSHVLVVGTGRESTFQYDATRKLLAVPVADSYERLPQKMVLAMSFFAELSTVTSVLKVDDDHRLARTESLHPGFRAAENSAKGQLGNINRARHFGDHSRAWHIGKCQDKDLGSRPYAGLGVLRWCDGASGYFVNVRGLRAAHWANLYFREFVDSALYEDMLMGEVMSRFGGGMGRYAMSDVLKAVEKY